MNNLRKKEDEFSDIRENSLPSNLQSFLQGVFPLFCRSTVFGSIQIRKNPKRSVPWICGSFLLQSIVRAILLPVFRDAVNTGKREFLKNRLSGSSLLFHYTLLWFLRETCQNICCKSCMRKNIPETINRGDI